MQRDCDISPFKGRRQPAYPQKAELPGSRSCDIRQTEVWQAVTAPSVTTKPMVVGDVVGEVETLEIPGSTRRRIAADDICARVGRGDRQLRLARCAGKCLR